MGEMTAEEKERLAKLKTYQDALARYEAKNDGKSAFRDYVGKPQNGKTRRRRLPTREKPEMTAEEKERLAKLKTYQDALARYEAKNDGKSAFRDYGGKPQNGKTQRHRLNALYSTDPAWE